MSRLVMSVVSFAMGAGPAQECDGCSEEEMMVHKILYYVDHNGIVRFPIIYNICWFTLQGRLRLKFSDVHISLKTFTGNGHGVHMLVLGIELLEIYSASKSYARLRGF